MTREEAIRCLSVHSSTNGSGLCTDEQHYEAKQIAIQALEKEPCENAISRQAVNTLVDELARAISDERCCISRGRSTATIMQDILDLPSVNPQPCEDAISRQAVLDKKELVELEDGQSFYCISPEDVETLPPVTPQPKTGHWINGDCKGGNCSICGEYYAFYPESGDFNYCPNCGAKMVEPQESEDKV